MAFQYEFFNVLSWSHYRPKVQMTVICAYFLFQTIEKKQNQHLHATPTRLLTNT